MKWAKQFGVSLAFLGWLSATEAGSAPKIEHAGHSEGTNENQLTLLDLEKLITPRRAYQVTFRETHFSSLLTEPIVTSGSLTFRPPSRIEKHVTDPFEESYWLDGEQLYFENQRKGISKTLSLHEYPALHGFVAAMRAALAGDYENLKHYFNLSLKGAESRWLLRLEPLDDSLAGILDFISFTGRYNRFQSIEIREPNGDHSLMILGEANN